MLSVRDPLSFADQGSGCKSHGSSYHLGWLRCFLLGWVCIALVISLTAVNLHGLVPQTDLPAKGSAAVAMAAERRGDFPEAVRSWTDIVAAKHPQAEAWAHLGFCLAQVGRYAEATDAYRAALQINPNLSGLALNLGLAEFKRGNFSGAIQALQLALRAKPDDEQVSVLLGMALFGNHEYDRAIEQLRKGVARDPTNAELPLVLAQAYMGARRYVEALPLFRSIIASNPDSVQAHMLAGEAEDALLNLPAAITDFKLARDADPRHPNVHFGLGYLYFKAHEYPAAL